jgi:hypothetical protein
MMRMTSRNEWVESTNIIIEHFCVAPMCPQGIIPTPIQMP